MFLKAWPPEPLIYAALVAILLLFRLGVSLQKRLRPKAPGCAAQPTRARAQHPDCGGA